MSWRAYQLLFRLETPLHAGWRRVGNYWQCRPYLPAYPLLCALAARLTESGYRFGGGHADPYYNTLEWLGKHVRFTYFFPALAGGALPNLTVYLPCYREDGSLAFRRQEQVFGAGAAAQSSYSECPAAEFDYLFMDAQARTALSYPGRTALAGALYHFEFLRSYTRPIDGASSKPVYLTGYLFFDGEAAAELRRDDKPDPRHLCALFDRLQVGGERRLGWGLLRLANKSEVTGSAALFGLPGVELDLAGSVGVKVAVQPGAGDPAPVLAHTIPPPEKKPRLTGPVEVMLRRETRFNGEGRRLSGMRVVLYGAESDPDKPRPLFFPGSRLKERCEFAITPEGLWRPN